MIMPDLEPFVSPVDGKVISGRAALREHDKRHGTTNIADFKETWAKAAEKRAQMYTPGAGFDRARRIEAIKAAYEKHSRRK